MGELVILSKMIWLQKYLKITTFYGADNTEPR